MQFIKKILFFISLFALYIILRELIELYLMARALHPYVGYSTLVIILAVIVYFVVLPIARILRIPVYKGPVTDPKLELPLIRERLEQFRRHPAVRESGELEKLPSDERVAYKQTLAILHKETDKIRKTYVSQLFYTSSISQNGFIDAILILSSSISMIKDIFLLYNGRVSNRDLISSVFILF